MEWTSFLKGAISERNNKWRYLSNAKRIKS
jgi:hypothetical protein